MLTIEAKRIRVLFVEDHQLLTEALSRDARPRAGHRGRRHAGSVADAKVMARERLDVVLMDYRLPDGTGRRGHPRDQGPLAGRRRS